MTTPVFYQESNRPKLHFSARQHWMNDPNGLVYYGGKYHLFYQHNPYDKVWGCMSWGHAVSDDLLHWEHRPVALMPDFDGLGYIFSGSAVVDWNNTSGFQQGEHPPIVAMFTHSSTTNVQVQSLAYSVDGGDSWLKYEGNPVISNPGIADFRDPKVYWFEPGGYWIMALAVHRVIHFYRSDNLRDWSYLSDFGEGYGCQEGVWECPDIFPLSVDGEQTQKWVLIVSINPGGPNGGSGTQYFVGEFDGIQFTPEHTDVRWLDFGPDNYAGVTWSDEPNGRRILIGWMDNWSCCMALPTAPWRGAMTLPRVLGLQRIQGELFVTAEPVQEFESLRINEQNLYEQVVSTPQTLWADAPLPDLFEASILVSAGGQWQLDLESDAGDSLVFSVDAEAGGLKIGRAAAAKGVENCRGFTKQLMASMPVGAEPLNGLRLVVDSSSVEVFSLNGFSLATLNYFSETRFSRLTVGPKDPGEEVLVKSGSLYELKSVWK